MPVQELQNQQGGLGTVIGLVGGYLAGNPARKAKQAQQEIENKRNATNDARLDSEARDRAAEIQSTITKNNFEQHNTETDRIEAARQQALYEKYAKIVGAGPPKNVSPQQWATNLQNQANAEGLTDMKLRGDLIADGQAVVAARAPKLSQVTHGLPQPVTSGKGAWTPQHLSRHYLDAAALVQNSDMPEGQKKAAVTTYQKLAADATSGQTAAERERHDRAMEAASLHHDAVRVEVAGMPPRGGRGGGANADLSDRAQNIETQALGANVHDLKSALRIVEHANLPQRDYRRVRQDVIDQFKPAPVSHDVSGLSSMGAREYTRDDNAWKIKAQQDPDGAGPEPDPMDAKYEKKATVLNRPATNATPAPLPGNTPAPTRTPTPANKPGTGKTITRAEAIRLGGPDGVARAEALGYAVH